MKRVKGLAWPALLVLCACGQKQEAAPVAAAGPMVEPVATVRQVMLGLTVPASDVLFQIGDHVPDGDAGWESVVATAAMLAESGNLLLKPPYDRGEPEWREFAQQLVAKAKDAMAVAGNHDVDAVLEAGNAVYETCENCHMKYLPPPPGAPQP